MLSDSAFMLIGKRFLKESFPVPGPGAGVAACRHADAMHAVAVELATAGHSVEALEVAQYARACRELAAEWYGMQMLPLMVIESAIKRGEQKQGA